MALGKNLENVNDKTGSSATVVTPELIQKSIPKTVLEKLPAEVQYKLKELDLKNQVLNRSCLISMTEKKGYITFVNDKFCEISGFEKEELIGQNHNMVRHPDMPKSLFKELWSTIGKGKIFVGNIKNRCKDGSHYWVDAYIAPILDSTGKPEAYIGIRYDITDLMEAKDEGETLQKAIDSAWASVQFTTEGNILKANENFISTFKYGSDDELIGKHHRILCDTEYAQSNEYLSFWQELAKGKQQSGNFKRIAKDGSEVWLQCTYSAVTDLNGKIVKVITIATDITERIREQEKLAASEEELRQNLEEMSATQEEMARVSSQALQLRAAVDAGWASIEFDLEGTILSANDNFVKTLGYATEADIVGKHHRIFVDDRYAKSQEYKRFWENLAKGEIQSGEFKRITKDGGEVWISASYTPVKDDDGKVIKVIKIAADITDMIANRIKGENVKAAVDTGWAFIEFEPDGTIIDANEAFLNATGYRTLNEIKGQHHSIFVDKNYALSSEYSKFWKDLAGGNLQNGEFARVKKNGDPLWLQAAYTPITDENGKVVRVIKIATDISKIKLPVLAVNEIVNLLAEGDLTREFNMDAEGYVKEMGDALNRALTNLNSLLNTINEVSQQVSNSADSLMERSQSMKNNTTEMASAISQMSKGAQDQAAKTDESSTLAQQVLDSAQEMEKRANLINKTAERGQSSSENGLKIVKTLLENMMSISSSANLTSDSIKVLTERAEEIARTLNVITDIASQTNLLALNAAIEAARAGDAGRGFAVVAEEIRKLAEDSRKSAVDIEKIIKDVQKDTQSAGKAIETMEVSVKQGNSASSEVEKIFEEIATSNKEALNFSKEILESALGQKQSIDSVAKNIEQIVVVAEETAAGTQQVASSSQELDNSMEEITAASEQLASVATELQAGVNQFKLKGK